MKRPLAAAMLALVAAGIAAVAADPFSDPTISKVNKFKAPLETYPNGICKTMLTAELGGIYPDGAIIARDVEVTFYDDRGELKGKASTESDIVYNSKSKVGRASGRAVFSHAGVEIEGDGLVWKGSESRAWFTSNSVVTIYGDSEGGGEKPSRLLEGLK